MSIDTLSSPIGSLKNQPSNTSNSEDVNGTISGRSVSHIEQKPVKITKIVSEKTDLVKHIEIFADEAGHITFSSLYNKFRVLHMGIVEATSYATMMSAGLGMLINKNPLSTVNVNDMAKLTTLSDPSCFKPDGTVDEDGLNRVLNYAQPGKDFLSELDIKRMISELKFRDATIPKAFLIKGVKDSWELLKRLTTDHFEKIDGEYVPCITKNTIIQYVKDSKALFKKVEDKKLPIEKPK